VICRRVGTITNHVARERAVVEDLDLDADDLDDDDDEFVGETDGARKMEPFPVDICHVNGEGGDAVHHVHCDCLEGWLNPKEGEAGFCPVCADTVRRIHWSGSSHSPDLDRVYCQHVQACSYSPPGFRTTSKIEAVLKQVREKPQDDKIIILSFFKGGLDLLEGVLVEEMGTICARFDGDVNAEDREKDLERFKTDAKCRVLLATVQSGGTGLNITAANHVLFLDRWFNPCVHDQAMDRCHRIGQTKEVEVEFFDVDMTIDQVMMYMNGIKSTNASLVLADGTAIGARAGGSLSYKELTGTISVAVNFMRSARHFHFESDGRTGSLSLETIQQAIDWAEEKKEETGGWMASRKDVFPNEYIQGIEELQNFVKNNSPTKPHQEIQSIISSPQQDRTTPLNVNKENSSLDVKKNPGCNGSQVSFASSIPLVPPSLSILVDTNSQTVPVVTPATRNSLNSAFLSTPSGTGVCSVLPTSFNHFITFSSLSDENLDPLESTFADSANSSVEEVPSIVPNDGSTLSKVIDLCGDSDSASDHY